jgi:hypothetical protein
MNAINIFICRELCREILKITLKKLHLPIHIAHIGWPGETSTHSHQYFHLLELGQIEWPYSTQEMLKCWTQGSLI